MNPELCRWMRSKALYGRELMNEAELASIFQLNEVPWSCNRTGQPWGPDDAVCEPGGCGAHRSCFEPSAKLVRRVG